MRPNAYNPNRQAAPEQALLTESLLADGWTQPIVVREEARGKGRRGEKGAKRWVIVDGAHRWIAAGDERVIAKYGDRVPVVMLHPDSPEAAMASTIRHNRARGAHGVAPMADILRELREAGWARERIMRELGMDEDEMQRFEVGERLPALLSGRDGTMRA